MLPDLFLRPFWCKEHFYRLFLSYHSTRFAARRTDSMLSDLFLQPFRCKEDVSSGRPCISRDRRYGMPPTLFSYNFFGFYITAKKYRLSLRKTGI